MPERIDRDGNVWRDAESLLFPREKIVFSPKKLAELREAAEAEEKKESSQRMSKEERAYQKAKKNIPYIPAGDERHTRAGGDVLRTKIQYDGDLGGGTPKNALRIGKRITS